MNNASRHPDPIDLLRLLDGELEPRQARQVRQHLETCWECRTTADEMETTIAECVRYRKNALHTYLPSPPAPWMDIYSAFSRMDATPGRVSFFQRAWAALWQGHRWVVPAAVAAMLLCAVYFQFRRTPAVEAAGLLLQASEAEQARPPAPRHIRIETSSRKLTRLVGGAAVTAAAKPAVADDEAAVAALFARARYNWEDPLSARSYRAWRDTLAAKADTVEGVHSRGVEGWLIRTSTSEGELASASLTVSRYDFRAVEGSLEFRNHEFVRMSEEAPAPLAAPEAAVALPAPPAALAPSPVPSPLAPPAVPAAGPGDELQVVARLHNLGADLGEPVEVSRSGGRVVVSGTGLAPRRQQELRAALGSMPNVDVRFADPAAAPAGDGPTRTIDSNASAAGLRFQQRLEHQLGSRALFEQFSAQVLDLNEAAMARAYALRRLAQQFPDESALSPAERRTLAQLARDHAASLVQAATNLDQVLTPALAPLGGAAGSVTPLAATVWQPAAEDLLRSARRVETLLAAVLDASPRAAQPDLPSQLLTAVAQLKAAAAQYPQLLAGR